MDRGVLCTQTAAIAVHAGGFSEWIPRMILAAGHQQPGEVSKL
jgi:hypothetical protein